MRRLLMLPLLVLFFGCAQNHFNVPKENFADRVKVLGVAPIVVDTGSDIKHPQKEQLIALVADETLEALCALADPEKAAFLREERAAILEVEGGLCRLEADLRAGVNRSKGEAA